MKWIVSDITGPGHHWLTLSTVTRPDQTNDVERTHSAPRQIGTKRISLFIMM
jgi:hypothetical protein